MTAGVFEKPAKSAAVCYYVTLKASMLPSQIKSLSNERLTHQRWVTALAAALWCVSAFSPDVWITVTNASLSHGVLFPAGLLLMVGLMLYPAGWGSEKVIGYCGPEALPFRPAQCSLGWAFYAAIGGTLASFLCAVLSAQAEIATSSDKVQEEIEEGKSLICLLWASRKIKNGKPREILRLVDLLRIYFFLMFRKVAEAHLMANVKLPESLCCCCQQTHITL